MTAKAPGSVFPPRVLVEWENQNQNKKDNKKNPSWFPQYHGAHKMPVKHNRKSKKYI